MLILLKGESSFSHWQVTNMRLPDVVSIVVRPLYWVNVYWCQTIAFYGFEILPESHHNKADWEILVSVIKLYREVSATVNIQLQSLNLYLLFPIDDSYYECNNWTKLFNTTDFHLILNHVVSLMGGLPSTNNVVAYVKFKFFLYQLFGAGALVSLAHAVREQEKANERSWNWRHFKKSGSWKIFA